MTLNEYIEKLVKLAKTHGELDIVYSQDDEGNGFSKVVYDPSAGNFENGEYDSSSRPVNAVCIN